VPEPFPADRDAKRSDAERAADHAAIDRLSGELLPALVAKLGATGLGELEVREGAWRVRLRRPGPGTASGHGPGVPASRERRPAERPPADRGEHAGDRPARSGHHQDGPPARGVERSVATSPAVGIYRPRTDLTVGDRVRAGDRLGAVDMLGVAQEVLAPVDGLVGASLAESGDAVEYGQELLVIEAVTVGPAKADRGGADVP
jgi:acetyl-CoA carboxylase biotin carboxyl carrier protein